MSQIQPSLGARAEAAVGLDGSWKLAAAVLGVLTLFRLLAAAHVPIVPDEAYYWLWSRGLSAGYYDHPPMIAWWIRASTALFGETALGIRFLPVLAALVSSLAVAGTAHELFADRGLSVRATLWFNAMLLIGVGAIFASPDAPSVMFWALSVWALSALRRRQDPRLWLLVGLLAGFGCLSKYTNLFFGVGLVLWLATDRQARRWLLSPWLWAGGLVAFLVFLPNLVWNLDHHWLTFTKQFARIGEGGASKSHVLGFLIGQFGLVNPVVAIFGGIGVVRAFRSNENAQGARFLVVLAAPLFVYMCLHSLHDRVQGNWPAPLYPAAAILAAVGTAGGSKRMQRFASSAVPLGIGLSTVALVGAVLVHAVPLPFRTPADRLNGWQGLASAVRQAEAKTGARTIGVFSYALDSELAWHLLEPDRVEDLDNRKRYGFLKSAGDAAKGPMLLVLTRHDLRHRPLDRCFATITPLATVERRSGNRIIERYQLVEASRPKSDILTAGCRQQKAQPPASPVVGPKSSGT